MNKFFNIIADGITSIADTYVSPRDYVYPNRTGFQADRARLRGDVARVGRGMTKVIQTKHGKQSNSR